MTEGRSAPGSPGHGIGLSVMPVDSSLEFDWMGSKVRLCTASDLPPGEMLRVDTDEGLYLAVYNVAGDYFATSNVCTHGVAMLTDGWLEDDTIECPQHGGCFNVRTGEATLFPCEKPLRTYPVVREGDDLFAVTGASDGSGAD